MVFNHFKVVCERGTPSTLKKMFTLNFLVENKCIEGKVGTKSKVYGLIYVQEKLNIEVDELRLELDAKHTEISHLKLKIHQ